MSVGLHIVSWKRPGKDTIWYVYAWRGGPKIHTAEGKKPRVTAELTDLAAEARKKQGITASEAKLSAHITLFKASPEFKKNAASTQTSYNTWLARIDAEFGSTSVRMWQSREMRGDVLDWRDKWASQPRSADEAIKVFNRLLNWMVDRGRLPVNVLAGINQLYEVNRSDLIWEERHLKAFRAKAAVEVNEALDLAMCTGLRRGDLVKLPWTAIGPNAIIWQTGKSKGKTTVVIPLLKETRELLARIKARHAAEMATKPEKKRKPLPATVLSNSRWVPWTPMGLGSRFNDAKNDSGVELHLHDARGTFITRLMMAGLTDDEIAKITGWETKDIAVIRVKYANDARVVIAIGDRIAAAQGQA